MSVIKKGISLYLLKNMLFSLFITFTSLSIVGCGGEAEYSFEDLQKLSGNFINGKISFISKDKVFVASQTSDVLTVQTNSTANVTYSIVGGEDGALFKIDSVSGKLSFIVKPLFLSGGDNIYEVLIATEDSAGNRAIQVIEVEVVADITKVQPVVNTILKNYDVLDFDGVVFQIDAYAADGQSALSYSVSDADADAVYFTIDSRGDLRFAEGADTSGKTAFSIDIVVTDGYGNTTVFSDVTITKVVSTSDIKPVILSQNFKIVENSLGNALIEIYKAPDAEITSITLSGGDAGLFIATNDAKLLLKEAKDFESVSGLFTFNMQVIDSHGQASDLKVVTVEIVDMDEKFHFSGVRDLAVQEGHTGAVITISADVNTIETGIEKQFLLEQGSEYFTIDPNGVISFKNPAQRDANITVQVSVESQFNGSQTLSEPFYIVVVDDPSKIAPTLDNNYPREVTAVETQSVLLNIQASLNGNATDLTYTLQGVDAGNFAIAPNGDISSNVAFNELGTNQYTFTVEITDNNGNSVSTDVITIILLQNPDEIRPIIVSTTFNVTENSTENINVLISSEGTGVVDTYLITGGADSVRFEFVSGALRFKTGADFESQNSVAGTNSYRVVLQVEDSKGNYSDTKEIIVNVTDIDETLQFTSLNSFTAVEEMTAVGTINATGKDETAVTVTYTLYNFTDIFDLDANSGVLTFKSAAELGNHYDLSISAESQLNGSFTYSLPVSVDVVAKSYAITFTPQGVATLPQNSVVNVPIEATSAAGRPLAYTMEVGTDSNIFSIDAATGEMTVHVPAYTFSNDPEANIYRGAVVATDDLGNSAIQQGELHIESVNGMPEFDTTESLFIDENQRVVAQLQAHSPIGSTLEFEKVLGADGYYFSVSADGLLTFDYAKNFEDAEDADGDNIYEVDIRVTDTLHSVNSVVQRFTVQVLNVNDAPTNIVFQDTGTTSISVNDGSFFFDNVENLYLDATASPSDGALYSSIVTNPDSSIFSMNSNGILRVSAPSVSSNIMYDVVIDVREDKGETTRVTMQVTILD